MSRFLLAIVAVCLLSCDNGKHEEQTCEQWDSLNIALNALYNNQYDNYWKYVAKKNISPQKKQVLFLALHQQYDKFKQQKDRYFHFEQIKMRNENEAEVFYTAIVGKDTIICSQNMVIEDGTWKIKLF